VSHSNRGADSGQLKTVNKVYVTGAKHRGAEKRSGNSLKREKSYKLVDAGLNEILNKVKPHKANHLLESTLRTNKENHKKSFKEALQIPPIVSPGFPASPSCKEGSKILYTQLGKEGQNYGSGGRKEDQASVTGGIPVVEVRDRNLSHEPLKKKERSLSEKVKKPEKGLALGQGEPGQPKQEYMVKGGPELRKSGNGDLAGKKLRGGKADITPDTSFQTHSKTGKDLASNRLLTAGPEYKKPNVYDSSDYFSNVGYKKLINKLEKPRESNLDRISSHNTVSTLSSKVKKKK
jgi:hypothetical protein